MENPLPNWIQIPLLLSFILGRSYLAHLFIFVVGYLLCYIFIGIALFLYTLELQACFHISLLRIDSIIF